MERKNLILCIVMIASVVLSNVGSFIYGRFSGARTGYEQALDDVAGVLTQNGFTFEWKENQDGSYQVKIVFQNNKSSELHLNVTMHFLASQYRPYGNLDSLQKSAALNNIGNASCWLNWIDQDNDYVHDNFPHDSYLISASYHPMTLTTAGKNWLADKIANSGGANVSAYATYIGASTDDTEFSAAWIYIPGEITTAGLGRATGAITDTGDGTWHCNKTFSITGTISCNLYGLYYDSYANAPESTLVCAEQQGAGNQKNMENGDTLVGSVQGTVS